MFPPNMVLLFLLSNWNIMNTSSLAFLSFKQIISLFDCFSHKTDTEALPWRND